MLPGGDGGKKESTKEKHGGEGRKMQRGKKRKRDRVVEYVSTCVCLWMRAAACMHVSLHAFMHECVFLCAA